MIPTFSCEICKVIFTDVMSCNKYIPHMWLMISNKQHCCDCKNMMFQNRFEENRESILHPQQPLQKPKRFSTDLTRGVTNYSTLNNREAISLCNRGLS